MNLEDGENALRITKKSKTLGFSTSDYPIVGVGGHLSGVDHSELFRKYDIVVDHLIDADANGKLLDRNKWGRICFGSLEVEEEEALGWLWHGR